MNSAKLLRKTFSLFIIFICSFQMAFADTLMRMPASADEVSIETLTKKIKDFGIELKGEDLKADCAGQAEDIQEQIATEEVTEEEKSVNFFDTLENLNQNSCGHYVYNYEEETEAANPVQKCTPVHKDGLIDKIVAGILEKEREEKEVTKVDLSDVKRMFKKAYSIKKELVEVIENEDIHEDDRRDLVITYLSSVVMNMRDLVVIKQAYLLDSKTQKFYNDLLPELPGYLFSSEDHKDVLKMGKNPSSNPFYLEVNESLLGNTTLNFAPVEVLRRDLVSLMKAPTTKNYLRALKWMTLQMMISQRATYKAILGMDTSVDIPRSCQNAKNGNLPKEIKLTFEEGEGDNYINNILASNGLIPSDENYLFQEYYLENEDKDPTIDGYSGLMPFQDFKNAVEGVKEYHSRGLMPALDDITHFERVKGMKISEVREVFKQTQKRNRRNKDQTPKVATHEISEIMEKILSVPTATEHYEFKDGEESVVINASFNNLSTYLAELMVRRKVEHYSGIVSDKLYKKLKANKINMKMPSLYGANIWRQWGLSALAKLASENRNAEKRSKIYRAFKSSCTSGSQFNIRGIGAEKFCLSRKNNSHIIANTAEFLQEFIKKESYVPLRRLKEEGYIEAYPTLALMWDNLRRSNLLPEANQNEYDFLMSQMDAANPWARVRLSYLVAMDELVHVKEGFKPEYKLTRRGKRRTANTQCFYRNVDSMISKLKEAAEVLNLERPLVPSYADEILNKEEKNSLWQTIVDENNEGNAQLFATKAKGSNFYSYAEKVSKATLLSREQIEGLSSKLPYGIGGRTWDSIDEVLDSELGQINQFFLELYKTRGDVDQHVEYFTEHAEEFGLDDQYTAKAGFLFLDSALKRPVFKGIVQEAAILRDNAVKYSMAKLCKLEDDNHEEFKSLFYATSKAQNQLNELAGLPAIPEEVMDKVSSMSSEEWTDMWLGLGAGVLGMAAVLIGGACTGVTGGLCAPLGVTMMAAGASALGMQVTLVDRELDRKLRADGYESNLRELEDLGFANAGSADEVSRSWFWTSFETISILPIIGVVTRSVKGGSRIAYASTKTFARQAGHGKMKEAWKSAGEAGKATYLEEDIELARYVIGLKKVGDDPIIAGAKEMIEEGVPATIVKKSSEQIKKIRHLYANGHITSTEMAKRIGNIYDSVKSQFKTTGTSAQAFVTKTVVKESVEEINKKTVETVTRYFNNSPKSMKTLLESYTKRWGLHTDKLSWARAQYAKAAKGEKLWGTNWFYKLRYETLAKNGVKMRKMIKELDSLAKNGGSFDDFVMNNMDDLTDLFMKIPLRKRELPYIMLLQGGPHVGGAMLGKRIPFLGTLADGIIVKKMFTARSRLVTESLKREAREVLKLPHYVAAEGTLRVVRAFEQNINELVASSSKESRKVWAKEMMNFQNAVAEKALQQAQAHMGSDGKMMALYKWTIGRSKTKAFKDVTEEQVNNLRRFMFNPQSSREKAIGEALWTSVEPEQMMDIPQLGEFAYKAAKELSDYSNVSEFDRYLNALKVLVIQKNPGKVEIM